MKKNIVALVLSITLVTIAYSETIRIYHIGNSLTWDSKPTTQASILEHNGYEVEQGYHIACGRGLTYIEANPDYTCVTPKNPYGKWKNALAEYEWDAVTIQAYPGGTGLSEVAATASIIHEATKNDRNQNCIFYLYLAWPTTSASLSFADRVLTSHGGDSESVFLSSGFLDYWHDEVLSLFPDLEIRVIPTGIAFANIDEKLREIEIAPYANTYDLYRDVHHMNYAEGRHVAMSSMLSAITGIRTVDIIYPANYFSTYSKDFIKLSNEVVWFTLASDDRTKIQSNAEIRLQVKGNQLEISFLGRLYESNNLVDWDQVITANSPFRVDTNKATPNFYRVSEE